MDDIYTYVYYVLIFSGVLLIVTFLWFCSILLGLILCIIIHIILTILVLIYYNIKNLWLKLYIYFDLHRFGEIELYDSYHQDLISFCIAHNKVYSYMCLHQRLPIHTFFMNHILIDHYNELKTNTLFISNYLSYLNIKDVTTLYLIYKDSIFIKHLMKNYNINLFLNKLYPDIKQIIYQYYIKSII